MSYSPSTRDRVAIIDIDATIADCNHRLRFINGEEKDWKTFYRLAHLDTPLEENIYYIKDYLKENNLSPIFSTGRSSIIQRDTRHFIEQKTNLCEKPIDPNQYGVDLVGGMVRSMPRILDRKLEDHRPAEEVKRDNLQTLLDEYHVVAVFDDDWDCLKMYEEELQGFGVEIFHVGSSASTSLGQPFPIFSNPVPAEVKAENIPVNTMEPLPKSELPDLRADMVKLIALREKVDPDAAHVKQTEKLMGSVQNRMFRNRHCVTCGAEYGDGETINPTYLYCDQCPETSNAWD